MNITRTVLSAAMSAATWCSLLSAQEKASVPTKATCLAFVQEFYGWYVPKVRATTLDSMDAALKGRRTAFSRQLLKGLQDVDDDARRNQEAGLDFDWILNSQDPGDPGDPGYLVRNSSLNANVCRVEVSRQRPDGEAEKIVPDLEFEDGRWVFTNFHYPDSPYPQSENLLGMISTYLKSARESPHKPN